MPVMLELQLVMMATLLSVKKNDESPNLTPSHLPATPSKQNLVPPSVPPQLSFEEKGDPHCSSPPIVGKVESISPAILPTTQVEIVGPNLASFSPVVYEARCNIPGVKIVNELLKKSGLQW